MTVLEDVQEFIVRRSPQATYDDCIAERLKLSIRQHANHKTRELAKMQRFRRERDKCGLCNDTKLVIRFA